MKSAKLRILFSVICLVAAVALAAFTVYAWFTTRSEAEANLLDGTTTSGDITQFNVNTYYATTLDGHTYAKGEKTENMKDYTPRHVGATGSETAILIELEMTFSEAREYQLSAVVRHSDPYPDWNSSSHDEQSFNKFIEKNYLSNAVTFRDAALNGDGLYECDTRATLHTFYTVGEGYDGTDDDRKRVNKIDFNPMEITDISQTKTVYFVMDYSVEYISSLYTIMLQKYPDNANLSTQILFLQDITFTLG